MVMANDTFPLSRRRLVRGAAAMGVGLAAAGRDRLSHGGRAHAQTPVAGEDGLVAAAVEAWVYGYPLLSMGVTADVSTNVAASGGSSSPYNQLISLRQFPDASFTQVVGPNVDTLYTSGFFDLSEEPLVFQWPDMGTRYFLFPFLDAWTDVVGSYGSRTTGQSGGTLVLAGPDWDGVVLAGLDLPADAIGLRVPTNLAWLIGRIYCAGTEEDYAAVHAIQDQLRLVPLSAWGRDYTPSAGTVDPAIDMKTPPVDQVNGMAAANYFGRLAELLGANPPYPADAPLLARLAALGIESGKAFDLSALDAAAQQALEAAPQAGLSQLQTEGPKTTKDVSGWSLLLGSGDFGTAYLFRGYVALIGLGANLSADAVYPGASTDSAGAPLSGANQYVVHFDSLPPVKGFWSLTAYNQQAFLIANPLGRYAIRGNDPLTMNSDGSLDLSVQADSPGGDKEANWLPVSRDQFSIYLRLYWPEEAVLNGTWPLPTITKRN